MHFFYDAQGRPAKVRHNGTIYSYILNLQGDIVGIIDTNGNVVVEYKYDAWGKALFTTGTLAGTLGALNPLRYRGYIYDEETGLYYLRSRYYNPLVGRFVSADELLGEKLLTVNVFSYCWNRPITKADKSGKFAAAVAVGGWIVSGSWGFFAKILGALGVAAIAGLAAEGTKQRPRAVSSSNVDEQTEVVPAPGPAPTTEPSASPSPKLTPNPSRNLPDYPGDDPGVAPEGYEWRGRGPQGSPAGNYYNPETGESLHPDLNHKPPIGPHWDYWNPDGVKFRIFPPN